MYVLVRVYVEPFDLPLSTALFSSFVSRSDIHVYISLCPSSGKLRLSYLNSISLAPLLCFRVTSLYLNRDMYPRCCQCRLSCFRCLAAPSSPTLSPIPRPSLPPTLTHHVSLAVCLRLIAYEVSILLSISSLVCHSFTRPLVCTKMLPVSTFSLSSLQVSSKGFWIYCLCKRRFLVRYAQSLEDICL